MFVLGIDPGLSRCGYGCVSGRIGSERAVAAGVITTDVHLPVPERLAMLRRELVALVAELHPDVVVVERVLFQTNARTAMAVGQASGVALLTAAERGVEVIEYSANEVKLAVAGYGSATKAQVQTMVTRLLSLAEVPNPPDIADALALALCHLAASRVALAVARS
jgi:crossover junction endodeoxyribonuclease RuvC